MGRLSLRGGARLVLLLAISTILVRPAAARAIDAQVGGAPLKTHDIVVTAKTWRSGLTVTVGATFRVPPPMEMNAWTLVYSDEVLRLLTPSDRVKQPGSDGWRFEARTRGEAEITVNGFAGATPGAQPNAPKFTLKVRVR